MALGIRGANPIWVLVNLAGKLFDDTYYMWVLSNQIPYIPAKVYHDPDLNTVWDNPIQFLANGTLPNDIYFESEVVYRLEFRQHIGLGAPSQSDPLIYTIENYVAGSGGSTPVDTVAFASSNQVTNPQFALVNFNSSFTFSGTNPDPIQIGPGWFLELAGTGTVTLTQVPLTSINPTPSNAPYALQITLNGWTDNSVFLSQRFAQSGVLWSNQIVSTAITARVQGLNINITATLVDSMGSTLGQLLTTTVDSNFNEYTGYAQLASSTDTDTPPAAYIDYKLALPSNVDIYVSSIQLVVQDLPLEPSFEQDSINRQIDHTYNTAYPIVPVGTVIDYYGFFLTLDDVPHYLPCNGTEISRQIFQMLFNVVTHVETVTLTMGSPTITVSNSTIYAIGYAVEGSGIPGGTTVIAISLFTNTITLSNNATTNGSSALRFFSVGNGDGATTFNTPDLRGLYLAGSGSSLLPADGHGQMGGSATATLSIDNMPDHNHPGSTIFVGDGGGGGSLPTGHDLLPITTNGVTVAPQGNGTAFSILPPTALTVKLIRFE